MVVLHVNVLNIAIVFLLLFLLGCGDSSSTSTTTNGGGTTSATSSDANASPVSVAWGTALSSWPTQGDPGRIAKTPIEQSSYNLWHDIRVSPVKNENNPMSIVSPEVVTIIETSRRIIDPLHQLNGDWAPPATGGAKISTRTIRGFGKILWSDLRLAVHQGDRERAVGALILLANLPRVARETDPSDRGLMPTLSVATLFSWGMMDISKGGELMALTPDDCARITEAASWVNAKEPFGSISETNQPIWQGFQQRELPKLREELAKLCGEPTGG